MKKVICLFALILGFGFFGFSQEVSSMSVSKGKVELKKSAETGVYQFELPEYCTKEEVAKRAAYYSSYFTVAFDEASSMATVKMLDGVASKRKVIARFLASNGVRSMKVDDDVLSIDEFIKAYL